MFYFDPYLMLIGGVCAILAFGASALTKSRFKFGQTIPLSSGRTGREVAEAILRAADVNDVQIVEHQGFLSDHYNPLTKTLALSPEVYGGQTAASAGVAAHEVGHAIQHAQGYAPMWLRSFLVPVANIGSGLAPWLIMGGFMLGAGQQAAHGTGMGYWLAVAGVALFGVATLFTVVTVPVEFNASARAKHLLWELGILRTEQERSAVSGVLTAAGLTYVAAAVTSISYLLYYAWRLGLFGRRDD